MGEIEFGGTTVCSLNVSDLDRSVESYREGLGFAESYRSAEHGWAELKSPIAGGTVGLQQASSGFGPGGATMCFTVSDLESVPILIEGFGGSSRARPSRYPATMV